MSRNTYTYVTLEIPRTFYDFVHRKFVEAGYSHLFNVFDMHHGSPAIDMQGIALVPDSVAVPEGEERNAEDELICAEEVLDAIAVSLDLKETSFKCIGDYITAVIDALKAKEQKPIDMVLFCPACHNQHIDAPDEPYYGGMTDAAGFHPRWDNPPHRSHLCQYCKFVWRPADVPTNGVASIKTQGKNDS